VDKATRAHWDGLWEREPLPAPIDVDDRSLGNHPHLRFHALFTELFPAPRPAGARLLEIGCARSAWLPYFARRHGFAVAGIDYSEPGCDAARRLLAREGVAGEVACADFREPPAAFPGAFDAVVSFGVVEHFTDTAGTLAAFGRFLAPGGLLVTVVPNLAGWTGRLLRALNPADYARHVVVTSAALAAGCRDAGLAEVSCRPFLLANFSLVPVGHLRPAAAGVAARYLLWWASKAAWALERGVPGIAPGGALAPYLVCVARRPAA